MILGICGRAGAGKDAICRILAEEGFYIIDADAIGRQALQQKISELVCAFGQGILLETGEINRKKLGRLVFSNSKALKQLNNIMHPYIVKEMQRLIHEHDGKAIALNAPLLPQVRIPEVQALVWIRANFCHRLQRALKRDKRGLIFTLKRMWMQRHLSPKLFFKKVDIYTIRNDKDLLSLKHQVHQLLDKLSAEVKLKGEKI